MDKEKIIAGAKLILEGIGEDLEREGLIETPERIARMYEEIFSGLGKDAEEILSKTFEVENNDLVIEKDITYFSMCEHHIIPFYGKAHQVHFRCLRYYSRNEPYTAHIVCASHQR